MLSAHGLFVESLLPEKRATALEGEMETEAGRHEMPRFSVEFPGSREFRGRQRPLAPASPWKSTEAVTVMAGATIVVASNMERGWFPRALQPAGGLRAAMFGLFFILAKQRIVTRP